jgi:hypothetical protein
LLGNLNGLVSTFPVLQGYADILRFNSVTAPAMTWLSEVQVPNWGALILGVLIAAMYIGAYRRLSPIYWPQPKITFQTRVETIEGETGPVSMAVLEAYNQEDAPITDCVATLETATNLYGEQMTPVFTIRNNRLRWSGNEANGDCKLSLPRSARRVIAVAETSKAFQFSSCKPSSSNSGLTGMYLIRVRVDGKLKGNPIEPQYFDGYLYVEDAGPELSMIFGKSDWKKDKRLRKLNRRGLFGGGK